MYIYTSSRTNTNTHTTQSHVPHMNESCPTYEWVMSHIQMSHIPHLFVAEGKHRHILSRMNESCPLWMSHVPQIIGTNGKLRPRVSHMNESCPTWTRHLLHMNESRPSGNGGWRQAPSYGVTWDCIHRGAFVTWRIRVWDMIYSCARRDSCIHTLPHGDARTHAHTHTHTHTHTRTHTHKHKHIREHHKHMRTHTLTRTR